MAGTVHDNCYPHTSHTSALSIRRFYPPFTHCHIRRSTHSLITHGRKFTKAAENAATCQSPHSYAIVAKDLAAQTLTYLLKWLKMQLFQTQARLPLYVA